MNEWINVAIVGKDLLIEGKLIKSPRFELVRVID